MRPRQSVAVKSKVSGKVREVLVAEGDVVRQGQLLAVVDPECRVIGVPGLRVADSSIFPRITNGNLNAPSMMVGEKAADHILGRRLPPSDLRPWINPRWRDSDR